MKLTYVCYTKLYRKEPLFHWTILNKMNFGNLKANYDFKNTQAW
jgi:hypothetical protein